VSATQSGTAQGTTRLGSYEIVRKLARGGMAELFLARTVGPQGFEKLVVLKRILPSFAENQRFIQLFLDEARLAATLDHPNVAHVHDMGDVDGQYFIVMEYIDGQDARSILRRTHQLGRHVPIEHAVQIAREVAAGLHYAHERRRPDGGLLGIVHRDVSPSNIIVSYDGAVKLVDFGVAKAATSSQRTRTGSLKGKVGYMSPEQARGAAIDRRSDIYSLGIVLWELVTTRRLFKAENDLATIQLILNEAPLRPSFIRTDCSPELERIVMRALSQSVDQRYQTAEQILVDLDELVREHKLTQSKVALASYMNGLFDPAQRAAAASAPSGFTLTQGEDPDDEYDDPNDLPAASRDVAPTIIVDASPPADITEVGPPPIAADREITAVDAPVVPVVVIPSVVAPKVPQEVPIVAPVPPPGPTPEQKALADAAIAIARRPTPLPLPVASPPVVAEERSSRSTAIAIAIGIVVTVIGAVVVIGSGVFGDDDAASSRDPVVTPPPVTTTPPPAPPPPAPIEPSSPPVEPPPSSPPVVAEPPPKTPDTAKKSKKKTERRRSTDKKTKPKFDPNAPLPPM
jgi:serine/threonine protein kinase